MAPKLKSFKKLQSFKVAGQFQILTLYSKEMEARWLEVLSLQ